MIDTSFDLDDLYGDEKDRWRVVWASRMKSIAEEIGLRQKVTKLLDRSRAQVTQGFPEAAIVTGYTALELFGKECVISALIYPEYDLLPELADLISNAVFGRNGRLQTLKRILDGPFWRISEDLWNQLVKGQELRNMVVHHADTVDLDDALTILDAIEKWIFTLLKVADDSSVYVVRILIQKITKGDTSSMPRNPARTYRPELQAEQSRRLRNHTDPSWQQFHRLWTAFNALYNAADGSEERERVRSVVTRFLTESVASDLLRQLLPPNLDVPDPPPGDTRYDEADPRFRERSQQEFAVLLDADRPSSERLGTMMVLVYQVRCSLLHGNKNPDRERDNQLVGWGGRVLDLVIPMLETVMS